jgi:arsenical pump membrane protein
LLFLASVIVLAKPGAGRTVFDVIATRVAITGRGSYAALFLLSVAFASLTTIVLEPGHDRGPDHPVLLAPRRAGRHLPALPLAMTTIWLANTASLLLPVSNLTNLTRRGPHRDCRAPLSPRGMWAPQIASIGRHDALPLGLLLAARDGGAPTATHPPTPIRLHTTRKRTLFRVTGAACLLFVAADPAEILATRTASPPWRARGRPTPSSPSPSSTRLRSDVLAPHPVGKHADPGGPGCSWWSRPLSQLRPTPMVMNGAHRH